VFLCHPKSDVCALSCSFPFPFPVAVKQSLMMIPKYPLL
jgi:hypothetical protein